MQSKITHIESGSLSLQSYIDQDIKNKQRDGYYPIHTSLQVVEYPKGTIKYIALITYHKPYEINETD